MTNVPRTKKALPCLTFVSPTDFIWQSIRATVILMIPDGLRPKALTLRGFLGPQAAVNLTFQHAYDSTRY